MAVIFLTDPQTGDTVPFREKHPGSPQEGIALDNTRIDVSYFIDHRLRFQAARALLGMNYVTTSGGAAYVHRDLPHSYPLCPWLYAKSINKITGIVETCTHDESGVAVFDDAEMSVTYEGFPWDFLPDENVVNAEIGAPDEAQLLRYFTETYKPANQLYATRSGTWVWWDFLPVQKAVAFEVPLRVPIRALRWTWWSVPYANVPRGTIATAVGCTNDAEFGGYPRKTLLLVDSDTENIRYDAGGTRITNVTFDVRYFGNGPNAFPDPDRNNEFKEIVAKNGTRQPFPTFDYNLLFRPTPP